MIGTLSSREHFAIIFIDCHMQSKLAGSFVKANKNDFALNCSTKENNCMIRYISSFMIENLPVLITEIIDNTRDGIVMFPKLKKICCIGGGANSGP